MESIESLADAMDRCDPRTASLTPLLEDNSRFGARLRPSAADFLDDGFRFHCSRCGAGKSGKRSRCSCADALASS